MMGEDFEIPAFTNASHDPAAWNQGGKNPFVSGGVNIQGGGNAFINQSGGGGTPFNLGNIHGGRNKFNVGDGGRASAARESAGSAPGFTNASHDPAAWNQGGENPFVSGGINIQNGGNAFINQSGGGGTPFNLGNIQDGINEFNVGGGGKASAAMGSAESASGGRTSGGRISGQRTTRGRGGNA
ncbi:hypothetical protein L195_g048047 [Trifolium pratense]|uniref:Uncharacterized protein n=2 Tax=Trifolium pratense TaxID=57577 RepID=A0A2K3JK67_TRIPR|nr:hypothetical protein L195_g048047 [Trifolium pratense]